MTFTVHLDTDRIRTVRTLVQWNELFQLEHDRPLMEWNDVYEAIALGWLSAGDYSDFVVGW